MDKEKQFDIVLQGLIEAGAIETEGIDPITGELLYRITDKMRDINPSIYDEHLNVIHSDTMYFWEKGFLDIDDITSDNPIVRLTSKAFSAKEISDLPADKIPILKGIIKALKK